nr:glycosyltransferase family 2 protein [Angustibacter aerolatus]
MPFTAPAGSRKQITIPEQRNAGVRAATGDVVVFVDSGCRPQPGWLDTITAPLLDGSEQVTVGSYRSTESGPYDLLDFSDGYVHEAPTINMAFTKAAYERVGGFDEAFSYGSDVDFCWRVNDAGMRIRRIEAAAITVDWGRGRRQHKRSWYYGAARARLYRKHPSRLRQLPQRDPIMLVYPVFLLGLPITLVFPFYPLLLLVPLWRSRRVHPVQTVSDHLCYGAGALAQARGGRHVRLMVLPKDPNPYQEPAARRAARRGRRAGVPADAHAVALAQPAARAGAPAGRPAARRPAAARALGVRPDAHRRRALAAAAPGVAVVVRRAAGHLPRARRARRLDGAQRAAAPAGVRRRPRRPTGAAARDEPRARARRPRHRRAWPRSPRPLPCRRPPSCRTGRTSGTTRRAARGPRRGAGWGCPTTRGCCCSWAASRSRRASTTCWRRSPEPTPTWCWSSRACAPTRPWPSGCTTRPPPTRACGSTCATSPTTCSPTTCRPPTPWCCRSGGSPPAARCCSPWPSPCRSSCPACRSLAGLPDAACTRFAPGVAGLEAALRAVADAPSDALQRAGRAGLEWTRGATWPAAARATAAVYREVLGEPVAAREPVGSAAP